MDQSVQPKHYSLKHVLVLFLVIVGLQTVLSFQHSTSSKAIFNRSLELFRHDSAERIADLTATSLDLLIDQGLRNPPTEINEIRNTIQEYDIVLSLQALQRNVDDICILILSRDDLYAIDNGSDIYEIYFNNVLPDAEVIRRHPVAAQTYYLLGDEIRSTEQIIGQLDGQKSVNVLVPLLQRGGYEGFLYMRLTPDLSNIVADISASSDERGLMFTSLILLGLVGMFYVSSNMVEERDVAREMLYSEQEGLLMERIEHDKEAQFTKRIYHTHHKAEKIMGFMKEDLRLLESTNIDQTRTNLTHFANFISRVIYDMKRVAPPVQVIRGSMFRTNINDVITFLMKNIFTRLSTADTSYHISLDLDDKVPAVPVNEYVVWEIIEPLIQNAIDHNKEQDVNIIASTKWNVSDGSTSMTFADDGEGIDERLLERDSDGEQKIFKEDFTSREDGAHSGYGCYIASQYAHRCGWTILAENHQSGGCQITITIPGQREEA